MPKKIVGLALGAALVLGLGMMAIPAGAAGFGLGQVRLIDTDIVVGFPQHAPTSNLATGHAPIVESSPMSETVASGSTVLFGASAYGVPTPTVQWQDSPDGGLFWISVFGATSTIYSFTASSSENGYEYRAVFTNSSGTATTGAAVLTVTGGGTSPGGSGGTGGSTAPVITTEPSSESATSGSSVSFSAAASGTPTPTVQWLLSTNHGASFSNASGATSYDLLVHDDIVGERVRIRGEVH